MDDFSFYAIAFLYVCDKHLANDKTSGHLWNLLEYDIDHKIHICNFKMEAVELAVEVRLLDENGHHGYSI